MAQRRNDDRRGWLRAARTAAGAIGALALSLGVAACPEELQETLCDAGTEVFCRCRGGQAGSKICNDKGNGFGACTEFFGECEELPDPGGDGGFGGVFPSTGGRDGAGGVGAGAPACAHELCSEGVALDPDCDPCAAAICSAGIDPFCCDSARGLPGSWDEMCVGEVGSVCGVTCSGQGGAGGSVMGCLTADQITEGGVVFTEIMNNPKAVSDAIGEWFELFNPGTICVDLDGLVLSSHNDLDHVIGASIVIEAGDYAVLGRSTNQGLNGNVPVAYGYGSAIQLANGDDTVTLGSAVVPVIDTTGYDSLLLEPDGASRSLDPALCGPAADCNDSEATFCLSVSSIAGSTDRGTPGASNDVCP